MRSVVFALACMPGLAWAEDFRMALPVVSAEVFPGGALIVLENSVEVPAGEHRVMTLLPGEVLAIPRPPVIAGALLTGVSVGENTAFDPAEFDLPAVLEARLAVEAAEVERDAVRGELDALASEIGVLDAKESFLRSVTGGDTLAGAEELLAVAAALAAELVDIARERRALEGQIPDLENRLEEREAALGRARAALAGLAPATRNWQLVTMDIVAEEAGPVTVTLLSGVERARWEISYEASLDEEAGEIALARSVTVEQSGALPWIDVDVKLSTANLLSALGSTEVDRSIARLIEQAPVAMMRGDEMAAGGSPSMDNVVIESIALDVEARVDADGAVVRYDLPRSVSLPLGRDGVEARLSPLTLEAEPYLAASPRFDETAFWMAKLSNQTGEPILPGPALFYRDGTLVGTEKLPLIPAGDETTLGFGPERDIALDVLFLDQQSGDRGIIRGQETREDAIRLSARNLGGEPHAVRLRYAVPTSQQEDLEVRVEMSPEPSMRDADDLIGVMEWELDLAPGNEQVIELGFDLRWPEGQQLIWRP